MGSFTVTAGSGSGGGGGGGGGGGAAVPPKLTTWCPKLGVYIDTNDYTAERCELPIIYRFREGKIVFFTPDFLKKSFCDFIFGARESCREALIEPNEKIYVKGGVYSTVGVVYPKNFKWTLLKGEASKTFNESEFETTFRESGNYTFFFEVVDSANVTYRANHSFSVLKATVENVSIVAEVPQENVTVTFFGQVKDKTKSFVADMKEKGKEDLEAIDSLTQKVPYRKIIVPIFFVGFLGVFVRFVVLA